jgi:SAM-dependent methyltransferase
VGADLSGEALKIAQRVIPEASLSLADMYKLPYPDAFFDVVIFCGMLEVSPWELKRKALEEAHRVLKDEGVFLLTTPNRNYGAYGHNKNMVNYQELNKLLGPFFQFDIKGLNPFPPFPFFIPNRILARIPGIWGIILFLTKHRWLFDYCHSFYVEGKKASPVS